mmetsp:Transcript_5161/g.11412  ORF Transcript_5161/g.11412 Transcript_5161/m.11412 type:complete len:276 (-) Transcript_5161:621-1448(-)
MSTESNTNIPVEKRWSKYNKMHVVQAGDEGFYSLVFARCQPTDTAVSVSFKLHAALWNPGPNYLSACEEALPVLFFIFFVFFAGATGVWIWLLIKGGNKVQKIHYMMAVLLVVKTMAMLFESIRYHFIATTGVGHEWSVIYYIFAFLKGLLLFTVILLIGTGWSLVKPYLNDRSSGLLVALVASRRASLHAYLPEVPQNSNVNRHNPSVNPYPYPHPYPHPDLDPDPDPDPRQGEEDRACGAHTAGHRQRRPHRAGGDGAWIAGVVHLEGRSPLG